MQVKTRYFSGQGVTKFCIYDQNGVAGPFFGVGDTGNVVLNTKVESYSLKENYSGTRRKAVDVKHSPELNGSVELRNFDLSVLAPACYSAVGHQASAAFTDKALGDVKAGLFYQVGLMGTTVSSVTTADGPLTSGYTVHNDGTISFTADHTGVTVSGSSGTFDYLEIMSKNGVYIGILFDGINTLEGDEPYVCQIWKASMEPLENLNLVTSNVEAQPLTIKFSAVTPPAGVEVDAELGGYGYIAFQAA